MPLKLSLITGSVYVASGSVCVQLTLIGRVAIDARGHVRPVSRDVPELYCPCRRAPPRPATPRRAPPLPPPGLCRAARRSTCGPNLLACLILIEAAIDLGEVGLVLAPPADRAQVRSGCVAVVVRPTPTPEGEGWR